MSKWDELKAPFSGNSVKTKSIQGKEVTYVTARAVMDRLDSVLGPENWRDAYVHHGDAVACTLHIRCGDEWVGKTDTGTQSNWEPEKGAYSDALKRAAVRWGIGRYLYRDGEEKPQKADPDKVMERAESALEIAENSDDVDKVKNWVTENHPGVWERLKEPYKKALKRLADEVPF